MRTILSAAGDYSPTPAETIIHGGRIATLDRARPFVSALAIARGRVLVPSLADALRMLRRQAERVRVIRTAGYAIRYPLRTADNRAICTGLTV